MTGVQTCALPIYPVAAAHRPCGSAAGIGFQAAGRLTGDDGGVFPEKGVFREGSGILCPVIPDTGRLSSLQYGALLRALAADAGQHRDGKSGADPVPPVFNRAGVHQPLPPPGLLLPRCAQDHRCLSGIGVSGSAGAHAQVGERFAKVQNLIPLAYYKRLLPPPRAQVGDYWYTLPLGGWEITVIVVGSLVLTALTLLGAYLMFRKAELK